jgi:hypothetical protein
LRFIAALTYTNRLQVAVTKRVFPLSTHAVDNPVHQVGGAAKLPENPGLRFKLVKKVPNPFFHLNSWT